MEEAEVMAAGREPCETPNRSNSPLRCIWQVNRLRQNNITGISEVCCSGDS
jgi:hypothetical protein